jgi:tRNA (cytidine/uridine-2'-O-)-methyltransferase
MKSNHPQICLYQPEIPQNVGNIARLAAATMSRLHLIRPFGFDTADKNLRRPGLDYWPFLDLEIHGDLDSLLSRFEGRFALLSKFGKRSFTNIPASCQLMIFGRETKGLPKSLLTKYEQDLYTIPMFHSGVRSLNLANGVSVVVYARLAKLYASQWGNDETSDPTTT